LFIISFGFIFNNSVKAEGYFFNRNPFTEEEEKKIREEVVKGLSKDITSRFDISYNNGVMVLAKKKSVGKVGLEAVL